MAAWSSGMILGWVREVPGSIPGAALGAADAVECESRRALSSNRRALRAQTCLHNGARLPSGKGEHGPLRRGAVAQPVCAVRTVERWRAEVPPETVVSFRVRGWRGLFKMWQRPCATCVCMTLAIRNERLVAVLRLRRNHALRAFSPPLCSQSARAVQVDLRGARVLPHSRGACLACRTSARPVQGRAFAGAFAGTRTLWPSG